MTKILKKILQIFHFTIEKMAKKNCKKAALFFDFLAIFCNLFSKLFDNF
jgi:hypothetical protein